MAAMISTSALIAPVAESALGVAGRRGATTASAAVSLTRRVSQLTETDEKHRHIRALHRQHKPSVTWNGNKQIINQSEQAEQTRIVQAAYEELGCDIPLAQILTDVWIEERQLRGETYDSIGQRWIDANGKRVD
jgi:hypothetical protein